MGSLLGDFRFAARLLARSPAVTLVAVLSLGLGIGANTTIFTLINEVFLQPCPCASRRAWLACSRPTSGTDAGFFGGANPVSRPNFEDLRERNEVLEGLAAAAFIGLGLSSGAGEPEQVFAQIVTDNYFALLGPPMAAGRGFTAGTDDMPGAASETVLSHGLWQRRFGADPGIVGRAITLNGHDYTVVGVPARPSGAPGPSAGRRCGCRSRCTRGDVGLRARGLGLQAGAAAPGRRPSSARRDRGRGQRQPRRHRRRAGGRPSR